MTNHVQQSPSCAAASVTCSSLRHVQQPPSCVAASVMCNSLRHVQQPLSYAAASVMCSSLRHVQQPPSCAAASVNMAARTMGRLSAIYGAHFRIICSTGVDAKQHFTIDTSIKKIEYQNRVGFCQSNVRHKTHAV